MREDSLPAGRLGSRRCLAVRPRAQRQTDGVQHAEVWGVGEGGGDSERLSGNPMQRETWRDEKRRRGKECSISASTARAYCVRDDARATMVRSVRFKLPATNCLSRRQWDFPPCGTYLACPVAVGPSRVGSAWSAAKPTAFGCATNLFPQLGRHLALFCHGLSSSFLLELGRTTLPHAANNTRQNSLCILRR